MSKIILIFSALILLFVILSGCSTDTREAWEKIEVRDGRTCVIHKGKDTEKPVSLEVTSSKGTSIPIEGEFQLTEEGWAIKFDTRMITPVGTNEEKIFLKECKYSVVIEDQTETYIADENDLYYQYAQSPRKGHIIYLKEPTPTDLLPDVPKEETDDSTTDGG